MTAGSEPQHSTVAAPELVELAQVLSKARCEQGLSQEALAQRLHMGLEQLQAFEAADPERLPEPVFVIAQARRLADALGVDVNEQIQALRRCSSFVAAAPPLRSDVLEQAVRPARPSTAEAQRPLPVASAGGGRRGASLLAWLLLLSGVGSGAWFLWLRLPRPLPLTVALPAATAPDPQPAPPSSAAPVPSPAQEQPRRQTLVPPDAAEMLVLNATAPCWLEIRPIAGGAPLFRGTLRGEKRVPLGQGLRLRAGRPDQLLVRQGDGEARPLGTISQIRWVSFRPAPPAASAAPTPEQRRL